MPTSKHLIRFVSLIACILVGVDARATQTMDAASLITRLEKIEPEMYFDTHGNAHEHLQELMIERFRATGDIMRSIDRLERDGDHPELVGALYDVLGFVKDPASIEWLRSKVASGSGSALFYGRWLPRWLHTTDGYGTWEWLEGRERWIEFLVGTFEREANEKRRVELLEVLAGFDDGSVLSFFKKQHERPLGHREVLIAEGYRRAHGEDTNDARITTAIETLARERANHQFLIEIAHQLRHPAFVPFLIDNVDREPEKYSRESLWNAQDALEKITFEVQVTGKPQWRQWFAAHGRAGRGRWLDRALDSLRHLMRQDEKGAVVFFEKAVYSWDDIALLLFIEQELVIRPAFRDHIAGWINLAYRPAYRSRLEPLARKVGRHAASLAPWARSLLIERGFLGGRPTISWREYVRESNRRV